MKRRILSAFLVLAMVLCLAPVTVFATEETQAAQTWEEVDSEGGLSTALGKGGSIRVTNNIEFMLSALRDWQISKEVNLDLNGHTVRFSSMDQMTVTEGGTLRVCDSGSGGSLIFNNNNETVMQIQAGGSLTLESGTIETPEGTGLVDNCGTVTVNGGTLKVMIANHSLFYLNGGTIYVKDPGHVLNSATLYANGGTVCNAEGCTGSVSSSGKVTAEESKQGTVFACSVSGKSSSTIDGGIFEGSVTNKGTITGGSFTAAVTNQGTITGGTFTGTIANSGILYAAADVTGASVTYDSTKGSIVTCNIGESRYAEQFVALDGTAAEPSAPTRAGYRFSGWYLEDGTKWDFTTPVTEPVTLTAQWSAIRSSSSSSRGTVTVTESEHGSVSVSEGKAYRGTSVTVTVTPETGYTLETLTVTDRDGEELDLGIVTLGKKYTFRMPSGKVTVTATFMEDNTILNYFADIPISSYYYEAVLWAAEGGIAKGDGLFFRPDEPCTRAQIVTFLWRAAGSPVVNYAMTMEDVGADAYYTEAVRWALSEGITRGTDATHFSPDDPCTRAQAVTLLRRAAGSPSGSIEGGFDDVAPGAYYADAVRWALSEGIAQGTDDTHFSPDDPCTRAQIVTFLWRAMAE